MYLLDKWGESGVFLCGEAAQKNTTTLIIERIHLFFKTKISPPLAKNSVRAGRVRGGWFLLLNMIHPEISYSG